MKTNYLTIDRFYDQASRLRDVFESRFQDSRSTKPERFVWDHWYVPDQYRLIRTPAYHYFPSQMYQRLHSKIVQWGRENLGCHDISPPWLSYYVDGCRQNFHSDVPHGPWAFVYSLSPKKIMYKGGETMILTPSTLDYWRSFPKEKNREVHQYVDFIPSPFNRLTVFDPRFPHGVSEVRGVEDPMEARLVVHGWFVEPRPYVVGGLTTTQVQDVLSDCLMKLEQDLSAIGELHGTLSLRLNISAAGRVSQLKILTDTVRGIEDHIQQKRVFERTIKKLFSALQFPKRTRSSQLTIPLLFKGS